ncbi:COP9 signalosome complex subunit 7b [Bemisia tabaci]|nr:PREDICTED: COP9 signalosome complex subunit 7b [Bemisia tabaci]XP_018907504.1 PREDICTED: COP9 signalosome complex subunit 7b [Bemisia tabaci]
MMSSEKATSYGSNPLEQFLLLAKSAKGSAAAELVKEVLGAPGINTFGELMDMPNIQELKDGPNAKYYNALYIFTHGTYKQYLQNQSELPELSPPQKKKLQNLTLVTLASKMKCIPYSLLQEELDIQNVKDLEDSIIEAIYADIIVGKMDRKNSVLEVDSTIGRDVRPEELDSIVNTLKNWCESCETMLSSIDTQIRNANKEKNRQLTHKSMIEKEIQNIKITLKSQSKDTDEAMTSDFREASAQVGDKGRKNLKLRVNRGAGKFWTSKS